MAGIDIFISYKSERRKAAEHLAAVLTHYGYSVWFDYQLIKGSDFGLQIGRRIREARALVVLWCSRSVEWRWVVEEAALGDRLGILIPVVIEPCELPVGFQRQDYIDMSAWDGAPRGHQLDPLIDALEQRTGRRTSTSRASVTSRMHGAGMARRCLRPSRSANRWKRPWASGRCRTTGLSPARRRLQRSRGQPRQPRPIIGSLDGLLLPT